MRWLVLVLSLGAIALSVLALERDRTGLIIAPLAGTGTTPATLYLTPDGGPAPVVIVAHGFAGSRQLMQPIALTLARAGYTVVSYDLQGHGRNPVPMSGDVTSIDGTTRLLVNEARAVARAALAHPRADGRLAYLGHSMASDIVVRAGLEEPQAQAVVGISMFSQAVTPTEPVNLLVITGEWEGRLALEALNALHLADPQAASGQTTGDPATGTGRRAVLAPAVEHVGVLYSATTLRETVAWLNAAFARDRTGPLALQGGAILLLLVAVIALAWPLARLLPAGKQMSAPLPRKLFWGLVVGPALVVPLVLAPVKLQFLPVLVADYLALHMGLYGVVILAVLAWTGLLRGAFALRAVLIGLAVAVFGIVVFGTALDRYVASFTPNPERALIIGALALGAVPYLLADAILTRGGAATVWQVLAVRGAFILSLMLAVALDFERLLFLLIILPVILLFFALFGTMAGWVGRRTGLPAASGLGLGLILAWALGVAFPLFSTGA
ncbi:MAG: alpha/beta hydrolase family protein [Roseinatronobacter sp.]